MVAALQAMGFKPHMIEVSEGLLQLKGYQGDYRAQKCNIRIKGAGWRGENYVGSMSNDLGFELMPDGTYAFHVSEYDSGKYNTTWQEKLTNEYCRAVVHEVADENNLTIEEEVTEQNGEIRLLLTTNQF